MMQINIKQLINESLNQLDLYDGDLVKIQQVRSMLKLTIKLILESLNNYRRWGSIDVTGQNTEYDITFNATLLNKWLEELK